MEDQEFDRESALSRLKGPGITLMIIGALGLLMAVYGLVKNGDVGAEMENSALQLEEFANDFETEEEGELFRNIAEKIRNFKESGGATFIRIFQALNFLCCGLMAFGGLKMMKGESLGLATTACIAALVPFIGRCCCISMVLGIWGLMTLKIPDVKEVFAS